MSNRAKVFGPSRLVAAVALAAALSGCTDGPTAPSPPLDVLATPHVGHTTSYTTIDVPGAVATSPQGINAAGHVVGSYLGPDNVWHGFLLSRGTFTSFDVAGAAGTQARGIGPAGDIVGSYWLPGEPAVAAHGFLRSASGDISTVDYPGHLYTIPQRILPDGTILGCRHDNDTMDSMKGVTFDALGPTEIDAFASMNNGATPDGRRVVGLFTNMLTNRGEAYILDDGVFTAFAVPNSIMTAAWDVNPRGDVAGVYRDATGFHGFVLSGEVITTIDFPGASATRVFGINAAGDVVGTYVQGGLTHGFVASLTGR
jgi:uncharacterized membrane protein